MRVIGIDLLKNVRDILLPKLRPHISEEDYTHYNSALTKEWSNGLITLDTHVYPRMFGFKDRFDYYDKVTVAEHSHKIKVPTFALDALDDQVVSAKAAPIKTA